MIQIGYSELTKRYYFLPEKGKKIDITEDIQEIIKSSRPSIDIDKVVELLRERNPFNAWIDLEDISDNAGKWNEHCDKLNELLNNSK